MSLHPSTVSAIDDNKVKLSASLREDIETIMYLVREYSALSDLNFLLHKSGRSLKQISLPKGEASWLPVRNVVRLLGKVVSQEFESEITEIEIDSMQCGCDNFNGNVFVVIDGQKIGGPYKWQWTAFADRVRNYNKFTIFPDFVPGVVSNQA